MNPRPRRIGGFNALDDLMPGPPPGPGDGVDDGGRPGEQPPPGDARARRGRHAAPEARTQHAAGYNALDDLLPGPGGYAVTYGQGRTGRGIPPYQQQPRRERVRMTFLLPEDLIEEAEDAAAFLAGPPTRLTLRSLAEQALRNEVDRLADVYHGGRTFPPRHPRG
jgi:hypothetical protein